MYRVPAMKRLDFGNVLKIGILVHSGVKGLLHRTGAKIPA
jgi:hypothetical protein